MRRFISSFTIFVGVVALALAVPTAASAWNPNPYLCEQPSIPIKYLPAWDAGYGNPSNDAAASWTSASDADFQSATSGYSGSIDNENFGYEDGYVGLTFIEGAFSYYCGGDHVINFWDAYYNNYHTGSFVTNKRRAIMAHELGHVLGLAHSGSGADCAHTPLMYQDTSWYDTCGYFGPRTDDILGANALY